MPRRRLLDAPDRRKRQNAEAQRAYRARQKTKLRNLEQMVVATWSNKDLSVSHQPIEREALSFPSPRQSSSTYAMDVSSAPMSLTAFHIFQSFWSLSRQESVKCYRIVARENFTVRDIVKYGLISMGCSMEPDIFSNATSLPSRSWLELVKSRCGDVDMTQVVASGVKILSQLTVPDGRDEESLLADSWQPAPRLCTNTITLSSMSFISAMLANAIQLKITPEDLMLDEAQSQFYHTSGTKNEGLEDNQSNHSDPTDGITQDLVPTLVQQSIPHHPWSDLIPWPSFRSNAIILSSMDPPLIDEYDLCLDLFNGGIRCWGSTHGRGQGVPWDSRSWEAAPWFLEKWKVLIGRDTDNIVRTSAWWRGLQGEGNST